MNPRPPNRPISTLRAFLASEAAGGLVLMASAAVALAMANSPSRSSYFAALEIHVLGLSLLHWINDGLMALFFLLVGLDIKREFLEGQLARRSQQILPGCAALGGMIVPALIYVAFNAGSPTTLSGWAIPSATDIAFSLGVLALLADRVPVSLRIFLAAVAVLDDLGAVIIIAIFYAAKLSPVMLALAALVLIALVALNRFGVSKLWPFLTLGIVLWVLVLKSGVHATIAGVLLALVIPLRTAAGKPSDHTSPLHRLERALHPWVAFVVLPVFGFANAGVPLVDATITSLLHPVTLGCAFGLFFGKQIGVFGSIWLVVRMGLAKRPAGADWMHIYGLSFLCGIGFTMSLFIGGLAFTSAEYMGATKIGVLAGSLLSAVAGWLVLRLAPHAARPHAAPSA
jgi:Na+:H+ antiporter, NhaA family